MNECCQKVMRRLFTFTGGKESGLLFFYRPAFLDVFSLYFVIEFRIIGEAVWKFF